MSEPVYTGSYGPDAPVIGEAIFPTWRGAGVSLLLIALLIAGITLATQKRK